MHIDLTDRVVVITGGGRGIGAGLVSRFAGEGARVVALDLAFGEEGTSGGAATGDGVPVGDRILRLDCDVSDPSSVASAVAAIDDRFGRIDVLVNNAGINVEGLIDDLDFARWQKCFDVNVGGVFLMSQAVAPIMKRQKSGRIINAASFAAIVPSIGSAAYAASKAAVVQLTRVLAGELGPWGVTVNAYAPGMIPTAMNGFAEMAPDAQGRLLDTLTLRRWETPDDVADLITYLASDQASYITGALIDVSGGKLATQIPSRAYDAARL
ncbi:SDR family NAD(P)-dependent oxidoreductase [Frondihabitans australicus]|uniref:3-oxoacyl-[acyl-carrier protein] reductase n=1 Tax=Frondihabitans australicus TaxID=386892 RepID=A0A495ILF8_9MICO|nr:SDR family NAD(P)-dependent oxidoreductase [Frondihabitans australicus]RKR76599.1 3-oxoacyl-[acyl-carrier protein] reductase [Frondihabitans australicus]